MKPTQKDIRNCFLCVILFLTKTGTGNAQITDVLPQLLQEFFISETVFAQEKKELQATVRPAYWKNKQFSSVQIPLLLEYGFTNRLQVEVTVPFQLHSSGEEQQKYERTNFEAGVLYNILKSNKPFALSAGLEIDWSNAKSQKDNGELEDGIGWEPFLTLARQFGRTQVHANLVAEIRDKETEFTYAFATATSFGKWLATVEINATFQNNKTTSVIPGVIWKGMDDAEFGLGISKSKNEWGILLMATYEFSLGKKKFR